MQQAPRETHKEIKGQPVNGAPVNNLYDNALIAPLSEAPGRKSLHADYCITSLTKEASQLVLFDLASLYSHIASFRDRQTATVMTIIRRDRALFNGEQEENLCAFA